MLSAVAGGEQSAGMIGLKLPLRPFKRPYLTTMVSKYLSEIGTYAKQLHVVARKL